jgi:nitroreductase
MTVSDALKSRRSIRAFLPQEVDETTLKALLAAAAHAPSGGNLQPWEVAVVTGRAKLELDAKIAAVFAQGGKPVPEYAYYPRTWREPFKLRRLECGKQLYDALKIVRDDKAGQRAQWGANFRAFDAPVLLLFLVPGQMEKGAFVDMGIFLQSVMLAALDHGLSTCPQAAFTEYAALIKEHLGYPADHVLIAGMALGYADMSAQVNHYRTPRAPVSSFTRFFGE